MRVLTKVEVLGLLGQFDHKIQFPDDDNFVVLHGPNGVGKTKLLEMIDSLASKNFDLIARIPFSEATFGFSDESSLKISKTREQEVIFEHEDGVDQSLSFHLNTSDGKAHKWTPDVDELDSTIPAPQLRRLFEREFSARQIGAGTWRVPGVSEAVKTSELRAVLGRRIGGEILNHNSPEWLSDFLSEMKVHLIETQRLLSNVARLARANDSDGRLRKNTAEEFSEDLARRISEVLATNSRTSQQLDRTFPKRVLKAPAVPPEISDDHIRRIYAEQSGLRDELEEIAALDNEEDVPLPETDLESWQRRVLWVYLDDTRKKLSTFEWILARTKLLREIVNSRFLNKRLVIDRAEGFKFLTTNGQLLDATQLSSGEQHELVLVYDLLFNVQEGTLVLIDEPEISLHVAWQQKFLADIERIAKLASLRFIVATHSPQVIHKWWPNTVRLGPKVEEE